MCDDFFDGWDDMGDSFSDPDNDYEEDMADDTGGEWYDDDEYLLDESEADKSFNSPDNKPESFDLADAMLWGMIGGAFYDSATDEKQRFKRAKSEDKNKK